ncbi:MAG: Fe-S-containing protein [Acidobacteriota bacterium]
MKQFKPVYGIALIACFVSLAYLADAILLDQGRQFERVAPDRDGRVVLDVSSLAASEVNFYRFLNSGNQEVKFFVGRDENRIVHVAFDASENDYKRKRGFRFHDGWMVSNKCDTATRLSDVSSGSGGCRPEPVRHRLDGDRLILEETDILSGWRYFR